jgi:hypothetical protein
MRTRAFVLVLLAAASAACARSDRKNPRALRPNWLMDVPYIPQSILVDTTGTPDVQHLVLLSPKPMDSVAAFYRDRLPPMGWRIVSDLGDSMQVSLYAERQNLPMWIQMDAQGPQTRVAFTATGASSTNPQPALPQR